MFQTLAPGGFDSRKLAPLYDKIYKRLQAVSKDNIMWFEPCQFPDGLGVGVPFLSGVTNAGFSVPPGGKIGSATHIMNEHSYCCQLEPAVCAATGEP